MARTRATLSPKETVFVKTYAETLNGTESAHRAYKTSRAVASVMASENLGKPRIKAEIERLLSANGIKVDEVLSIHKRNMLQEKHLPTSQKAVESLEVMLGIAGQEEQSKSVQVAFILNK